MAGLSLRPVRSRERGLTLLELIVVIAIAGTILLLVFPKIPYLEGFALKSEARHLSGLVRYLDESASSKKIYYRLSFHRQDDSIGVESSVDGIEFKKPDEAALALYRFKRGVTIADIVLPGVGAVVREDAAVTFNPGAGAPPFVVHLQKDGGTLTLNYNPYSGRVRILDGNV